MTDGYRYRVTLEGYDHGRTGELKLYLKTLHPKVGENVLKDFVNRTDSKQHPVIYETNSKIDAVRIAHMIATKGGAADVLGLDDETD